MATPWGAIHQIERKIRDISEPFMLLGLLEIELIEHF